MDKGRSHCVTLTLSNKTSYKRWEKKNYLSRIIGKTMDLLMPSSLLVIIRISAVGCCDHAPF